MRLVWTFLPALALLAAGTGASMADSITWAYVDDDGVMRWEGTDREVCLFGVNYYTPCSVSYRNTRHAGVPHRQTIDEDLHHLARMGVDVLRLHVFDREISDAEGNLLENEHLELIDYLVQRAAGHGMRVVLTPIAWWWTPVEGAQGFSSLYSKGEMVVDPSAIDAQRTYLTQFMSHVNPLTELSYGQDPSIIAVELINEPTYDPGTTDEQVVSYINALAEAVREGGARQPVLYNVWQDRHAVLEHADVDGATFGWYPTGLMAGGMLEGDYLPAVEELAELADPLLAGKARIVYEFDAADMPGGYLYPPMARAFRAGGVQVATQFQYDPISTAQYNSDWGTHYLSLPWSPRRAVGFVIAGEVFRRTALFADREGTGSEERIAPDQGPGYEDVTIDSATDTVVLNTPEVFMNSGSTDAAPVDAERLQRVVGYGSSKAMEYDGTGVYFANRLDGSMWRLEVYPDAVWVRDPFSPGEPYMPIEQLQPVARAFWRDRRMAPHLPGLAEGYAVEQINGDREGEVEVAEDGSFVCRPGVYVLRPLGAEPLPPEQRPNATFIAPQHDDGPVQVWHEPARAIRGDEPLTIAATVAAGGDLPVRLHWRTTGEGYMAVTMEQVEAYRYAATISPESLVQGEVAYWISVGDGESTTNWPGEWAGDAGSEGPVLPPPMIVCDPGEQAPRSAPAFVNGTDEECACRVVRRPDTQGRALRIESPGFAEGQLVSAQYDAPVVADASAYAYLEIDARAALRTERLQVALVERDGTGWGADIHLGAQWRTARVALDSLRPLWGAEPRRQGDRVRLDNLGYIQVSYGWWQHTDIPVAPHIVELDQIRLAPGPRLYTTTIAPEGPIALLSAEPDGVPPQPEPGGGLASPFRTKIVPTREGGFCLRAYVEGFGDGGFLTLRSTPDLSGYDLSAYNAVRVRARGLPQTTALELSLVVVGHRGWGANVPLTPEWQDIIVPLEDLHLLWNAEPAVPDERIDLTQLTRLQVCFGAWLYGEGADEVHGLEIEEIALVHIDPPPTEPATEEPAVDADPAVQEEELAVQEEEPATEETADEETEPTDDGDEVPLPY